MIITVTLNAAIDKSLSVPNFRLGRRHRTVEQTTMAGGKGVNVARTLKTLGQPVIATGLRGRPDRHAHRRAAHRGVDPQRLRAHPRGVAHEHGRLRPDERRADRDQRARPGGHPTGDRALPRQAALPGARRRHRRLRRLAAARRGPRRLRRADPRPARMDVTTVVDTDGEPLRHAVRAEPDVISPNVLEAEELVGHEFNDEEDRVIAVREMVQLGAREAIMTVPDGCFAPVLRRAASARSLPRLDRAARGRSPPSARATPSSPATSPPATPASRRRSACASASPAARSPRSGSGAGLIDPARGRADWSPRRRSSGSPCPPRSPEPRRGVVGAAATLPGTLGCRLTGPRSPSQSPPARALLVRPRT